MHVTAPFSLHVIGNCWDNKKVLAMMIVITNGDDYIFRVDCTHLTVIMPD